MNIEIRTNVYSVRRYGRPWIAVVSFDGDLDGKFQFGHWVGQPGEQGLLKIDAQPGDIIATGQHDYRNAKPTPPDWFEVREDGELQPCLSKVEAYDYWRLTACRQAAEHAVELELCQPALPPTGAPIFDVLVDACRAAEALLVEQASTRPASMAVLNRLRAAIAAAEELEVELLEVG